ncbi:MAG: MFS transporter [Pseudomonadales bacterium]|nr:MFS transporter [Pseudomonadales bacterium]MCP5171129.1 MFS transporter [Pseudomonadales bacterium]MCP5301634.1 MFS transporter [Pseudomonadales bacterium]
MTTYKQLPRYRYFVLASLWLTIIFLYLDRANISMAAPFIKEELNLSATETGLILSIFYWGYMVGQIAGGVVSDRYNIRRWTLVLYFSWVITTMLTGLCRTAGQLAFIRVLFGIGEGAVINPVTKLQNHWAFPQERGFVNGIYVSSGYLGLAAGIPLVGMLISVFDWRMMFYVTGAVTLLGVIVFWLFVYDHPGDHPRISEEEKNALQDALVKDRVNYDPTQANQAPLSFFQGVKILFSDWTFWVICTSIFFILGVYFTCFAWIPGFLVMERGMSSLNSGLSLTLPYLAAAVGAIVAGYLGDKLNSRSAVIILATLLTIPPILGLFFVESPQLTITMLCLTFFFNAAAVSKFLVLTFDLYPAEIIGVALAVEMGLFAGSGGIIGPILIGYTYDLTGSFFTGFASMAAGMMIAAIMMAAIYFHERKLKIQKMLKLAQA